MAHREMREVERLACAKQIASYLLTYVNRYCLLDIDYKALRSPPWLAISYTRRW